jgi:hypothetical protein
MVCMRICHDERERDKEREGEGGGKAYMRFDRAGGSLDSWRSHDVNELCCIGWLDNKELKRKEGRKERQSNGQAREPNLEDIRSS